MPSSTDTVGHALCMILNEREKKGAYTVAAEQIIYWGGAHFA